uniref:Uncharacterized protein n=1 Tax=Anguilla anguilla TaxID=7936 RepID=A0A0E9W9K4_ANGAN
MRLAGGAASCSLTLAPSETDIHPFHYSIFLLFQIPSLELHRIMDVLTLKRFLLPSA